MDDNCVPEGMECPNCHESDPDKLHVDENETVVCTSCGTVYQIE
jgi:hypothetical protein